MPSNVATLHPGFDPSTPVNVTMMVDPTQWKEHPTHEGIWYAKQDIHPNVLAKSCGFDEKAASLLHSNTHGLQKISTTHVSGLPDGTLYAVQHGGRKADGTEYPIDPRQSKIVMTQDRALPCDDVYIPGQIHQNSPAIYDHSVHPTAELARLSAKWHNTSADHIDEGTIKLDATKTNGKGARRLIPVEHETNPTSKLLENKSVWSQVGHSGIMEHDGVKYHDCDEAKIQNVISPMTEVLQKTRAGTDPRVITHYAIGEKPTKPVAVQYNLHLGEPVKKFQNPITAQVDDVSLVTSGKTPYNLTNEKPITTLGK